MSNASRVLVETTGLVILRMIRVVNNYLFVVVRRDSMEVDVKMKRHHFVFD
jgi:hypothetical protein